MFGSLEVDGQGQFVNGNGNYQPSGMVYSTLVSTPCPADNIAGTYRTVTRDGM